jgi:fructokinase
MGGPLLGAIEAGGTKFICAIGTPAGEIVREARIPTGSPGETMAAAGAFFASAPPVQAIGLASFGPIQLDRGAADYGFITSTPKPDWRHFDIVGAVRNWFRGPIGFDTDVNAAALAENRWGAAKGLRTFLYVTVGTGIGAGAMVEGALLHGRSHPEMGHIRIPHDCAADPYRGGCPYHGDCLEGLASGPAIQARWQTEPSLLDDDHPAWTLEAHYLALAAANWTFAFAPERIIFGGGVMREPLVRIVRDRTAALLGGYMAAPDIVRSGFDNRAGVMGALALAGEAPTEALR